LALLLHAFGELYKRGIERVGLGVHGENPTSAPRLYERAGMVVTRRYDHYARHLVSKGRHPHHRPQR
jgi:ribosomal protein S18 acetylase RimI-like enzyme